MGQYSVNPQQCALVLTNVEKDARNYETAGKSMGKALQGAATHSQSGIVAEALGGYAEKAFVPDMKGIVGLTNSAAAGLTTAVGAVLAGNDEMAQKSISSLNKSQHPQDLPKGQGGRR